MKTLLLTAALLSLGLASSCNRSGSTEAGAQTMDEAVVEANADANAEAKADPNKPDVIYVPTPQPVVDAMLKLAKVETGDVLYDLGSGDGRIPITAARDYSVRAVGIEIDPERIAEANANIQKAGVGDLVTIRSGDLFQADFREATVVTLYLLETLNEKLRPKLLSELRPGTRIVSHAFRMGDWEPEAQQNIDGNMIYLWTVPPRE